MDCRVLSFRELPHQAELFLDFTDHFDAVKAFYAHPPTLEAVREVARGLPYPEERRREIVEILARQNQGFGAGAATMRHLERLAGGAVAVVTGQQAGLLSGPAFSFYKALTAIQIAAELTEEGIEAVPIFWMATEDHDLEEVRGTNWFIDGRLERFELPVPQQVGGPVGRIALGDRVSEVAREAAGLLEKAGDPAMAKDVAESYRPSETYGSAFAKLLSRLFRKQGLLLVDPLDECLRAVAAPFVRKALEQREPVISALLEREKDLEQNGYEAQVKVSAKNTLLFHLNGASREAITVSDGAYRTRTAAWSPEELAQLVEKEPGSFSPNALLRPVTQDYLFPTAAYVGGPAEISYFAQSEVIYRHLLGRMPVLLPRAGFTLVDSKAVKLLQKYDLEVEDVWRGAQLVRKRMEAHSVPPGLAERLDRAQAQTSRLMEELGKEIEKLDSTLKGAVDNARSKINFQLDNLRQKAGRALDERTKILAEHERYLDSLLYPNKTLQSRELCLLPLLARWGSEGMRELQQHCSGKKLGHHFIIRIP